nr:Serine carboxypeptidase-like 40 [Ipomoea batatas]
MAKVSLFFTFSFLFLLLATYIQCYEAKGFNSLSTEEFLLSTLRYTNVADDIDTTQLVSSSNVPTYIGPQDGLKESDKIETLPGQSNKVDFTQYAGHVTVNPDTGKALFYYFTESPQNPSSKPLVLWLNGGPGCSSLGGGAFGELGPFRPAKDGKTLNNNPYAWNNVANIIFLESPIGVGFSYSNTSSDYDNMGDDSTAQDSYTFLVNWLERFPEYKTRDFYITGESYAGHYIPQLAQLIVHNNQHTNQSRINLKGIAIGNGDVDYEANLQGIADYSWSHALISDELYKNILTTCNFSTPSATSEKCFDLIIRQRNEESGNIYPYDIYAPLCDSGTPSYSISGYDPCTADYTYTYLNTLQVQAALHANITATAHPWRKCNFTLGADWKAPPTVLPVITELMGTGIRIWLYSGDTDTVVPITGTRYALYKLGVTVKTPWYPWYLPEYEVGGYVEEYENITYEAKGVNSLSREDFLFSRLRYTNVEDNIDKTQLVSSSNIPVYIGPQDGLKESDMIETLPGQSKGVDFAQYAGHVTVDPVTGKALFYYFTESPQNPSSKPLVLWLNGGPGCSSLGGGAFGELGPFRPAKDGKSLNSNPYAWNNVANIIFLESPIGVGFSYSNTSSDYDNVGDESTAQDSYTFLVNWLERFPEYKTRDFYITGESYAGHYIPQLAQLILHNNQHTNQSRINLKGIAIGNAYVDYEANLQGLADYYWSHALISDELYKNILSTCNFSIPSATSDECLDLVYGQIRDESGNIYSYDIYAPLCGSGTTSYSISGYDPCTADYTYTYLNTLQVQAALHANITATPHPWDKCNLTLHGAWKVPPTVLPVITELMGTGIRIWLYSGDTDNAVPITDTRYALYKLGVTVKTPWYPWYLPGYEVGGYVEEYENITLVTVRGSGHFVPSYQPARALVLFSSFINGTLPPNDTTYTSQLVN